MESQNYKNKKVLLLNIYLYCESYGSTLICSNFQVAEHFWGKNAKQVIRDWFEFTSGNLQYCPYIGRNSLRMNWSSVKSLVIVMVKATAMCIRFRCVKSFGQIFKTSRRRWEFWNTGRFFIYIDRSQELVSSHAEGPPVARLHNQLTKSETTVLRMGRSGLTVMMKVCYP